MHLDALTFRYHENSRWAVLSRVKSAAVFLLWLVRQLRAEVLQWCPKGSGCTESPRQRVPLLFSSDGIMGQSAGSLSLTASALMYNGGREAVTVDEGISEIRRKNMSLCCGRANRLYLCAALQAFWIATNLCFQMQRENNNPKCMQPLNQRPFTPAVYSVFIWFITYFVLWMFSKAVWGKSEVTFTLTIEVTVKFLTFIDSHVHLVFSYFVKVE